MKKNYCGILWEGIFCKVCLSLCLLLGFSSLYAQDLSKKEITLRKKNVPLVQVLLEVQKQSGANFVYEKTQLEHFAPLSLDVD